MGAETFDEILEGGGEFASANDLEQETTVLDENDSEASVIKFVNQVIREALQERAAVRAACLEILVAASTA